MARKKRWLRWMVISALSVVLTVGVIALAFLHRPGWYQPVMADETTIQQAQIQSARMADTTSKQMVEKRDFAIQLTDGMVNEWLAAMPMLWPEARRWLPPEVRDPAVAFDAGEMRIGVHVERAGWRVIASAALAAEVSEDRSTIRVALRGVRGGSLPMPEGVVESLWQRLLSAVRRGRVEGLQIAAPAESANESIHEMTIRNHFIWPNGERPFRITQLGAEKGVLTIGMEPL